MSYGIRSASNVVGSPSRIVVIISGTVHFLIVNTTSTASHPPQSLRCRSTTASSNNVSLVSPGSLPLGPLLSAFPLYFHPAPSIATSSAENSASCSSFHSLFISFFPSSRPLPSTFIYVLPFALSTSPVLDDSLSAMISSRLNHLFVLWTTKGYQHPIHPQPVDLKIISLPLQTCRPKA